MELADELLLCILQQIEPQERRLLVAVCRRWQGLVCGLQRRMAVDLKDVRPLESETRSEGYGSEGYGSEGYGSEGYGSEGYGSEGYGSEGYGSAGHSAEQLALLARAIYRRQGHIAELRLVMYKTIEHCELAASLAALLSPSLSCLSLEMRSAAAVPTAGLEEQPPLQWMALLSSLERLTLSNVRQVYPDLGRLPALTYLRLFECWGLKLPSSITRLTCLDTLEFDVTEVLGGLTLLGSLPQLRQLQCKELMCRGLSFLQTSTQITRLEVTWMDCRVPPYTWEEMDFALRPLTQLEYLDLSCNALDACPPCVAFMPNLQTLLLVASLETALPVGPYLSSLRQLDLTLTDITELPQAGLSQLTQLTALSIGSGIDAQDAMSVEQAQHWCQQLQQLPRLARLELLTQDSADHGDLLRNALPQVAIVGRR